MSALASTLNNFDPTSCLLLDGSTRGRRRLLFDFAALRAAPSRPITSRLRSVLQALLDLLGTL